MLTEHIKKRTAPLGAIPVKRAPRKRQGEGCSSPRAGAGGEALCSLCGPASVSLRAGGELGAGRAGLGAISSGFQQRQEWRSGKILWGFFF